MLEKPGSPQEGIAGLSPVEGDDERLTRKAQSSSSLVKSF